MSKFAKPKPQQEPTKDDIDRVIGGAEAKDGKPEQTEEETRFTLALSATMTRQVDAARKRSGGMARLAWIRLAIAEKLARDGG